MNDEVNDLKKFSWSRISSYMDCPRLYYNRYILKLKPKIKAAPLAAGGAISRGMEAYRRTGNFSDAGDAIVEQAIEDNSLQKLKEDDPKRSVERLLEIFKQYTLEYPNEADFIVSPEVNFKMDLPELSGKWHTPIVFIGRIDGVYRLADKTHAIIEDKTTSVLGPKYFDNLKQSPQVLWYLVVAKEQGLFDVGKGTAIKCLLNAIYMHEKEYRFRRDITIKSKTTIDRAKVDLFGWIDKIMEAEYHASQASNEAGRQYYFPRITSYCPRWGGCEFLPIRDLNEDNFDRFAKANYLVKDDKDSR